MARGYVIYVFCIIKQLSAIDHATIWISSANYNEIEPKIVHRIITSNLTHNWSYNIQSHNYLDYGECIDANRVSIRLSVCNVDEHKNVMDNTCNNTVQNINGYGFRQHIDGTIAIDHNVNRWI